MDKKIFNKKDLFTIPNIIGYVRILLIPVFCWLYVKGYYGWAVFTVLFSSFTDLFDGMIARKFNQVTELGKVLDPVADKMTHFALAILLALRYPLMWALLFLMVIKEGYMAIAGLKHLGHNKLDGAMWYGKVCTATLFAGLFLLFCFYNMPLWLVNTMIIVMMVVMEYTFIRYIMFYRNMDKRDI